jgi:hypothetical protein
MDPSGFLKGNERATVTARIESASEARLFSLDQSSLQSGCNIRWLLFPVYPSTGSGKTHASDTGVFMKTLAMNTSSDLHLRNAECEERHDSMFGMLNMNDSETVFCSRYTILNFHQTLLSGLKQQEDNTNTVQPTALLSLILNAKKYQCNADE